ncbi:restriction endonuclease subunit S [Chryseobacterium salviniae]|uniref:Restriction endonuclease subunit S n=1 Tax=Chryseobacterium salviniae TaxID=3101750 RepID=A0ABU6HSC4_9FLAO|nr:restriction endonuclease subunit S [Chryseobacterium sp. T9W2-O]MEC3875561.1 restriction endonuclease subunit S [Chryseobacterium sp. T9W2-O]
MTEENKSVKNFPNLRFPGFEEEWEVTILGKCVYSFEYGMNASAIKFDGENRYIRITDIDESSSKYKPEFPVSPNGQLIDKYLVSENDILFARTGASTGKSYLYNKDDGKLYFAGFLIRAKIKEEFNSYFVFTQTKTIQYYKWVQLMSMRSGQPGINSQEYASYSFNIPSKNEQDKIASFLLLLDERISTQKKIIEQLETLMKGVSYKLFNRKIRFKNTELSEFPSWESKKGNEVFSNISNKNHNSDLPILAITQDYGAIPRDLIDFQISVSDKSVESYKVVEKGDFIISLRSFQGGIEYSEYKGICSPAYVILRNKIEVNSYFYKYYFKSESYIKQLNKKLEGIRDGKMISYAYFSDINLPLPSLNEQTKIANFLSSIQDKIETEKQILKKLELQKKFLLANLFV